MLSTLDVVQQQQVPASTTSTRSKTLVSLMS
jgi:hypothetical protein